MTSHSADAAALTANVGDLRKLVTALEPFIVPGGLRLTDATWGDIRTAIHAAIHAVDVSLDRNLPEGARSRGRPAAGAVLSRRLVLG